MHRSVNPEYTNTRYRKARRFFRRNIWEPNRLMVGYCTLVAVALALFLWSLSSCGVQDRVPSGRQDRSPTGVFGPR